MGYTHYWKFIRKPSNIEGGAEMFKEATDLFKEGLELIGGKVTVKKYMYSPDWSVESVTEEEVPMVLKGGDGFGEPTISDTQVVFNGDGEMGWDHETFYLTLDSEGFDFCKTARKPYDTAVCLALLCFKHIFGEDFSFSSDGDIEGGEEGWAKAKEIFAKLTE